MGGSSWGPVSPLPFSSSIPSKDHLEHLLQDRHGIFVDEVWMVLHGLTRLREYFWPRTATYDQPSQLKITEKFWCILTRRTFQKGLGNKHLKVRLNVNKKILGLNRKLLKLCYENVHFKLFRAISWALANDFNRLIHSVGLFVLYCPISDAKSCLS